MCLLSPSYSYCHNTGVFFLRLTDRELPFCVLGSLTARDQFLFPLPLLPTLSKFVLKSLLESAFHYSCLSCESYLGQKLIVIALVPVMKSPLSSLCPLSPCLCFFLALEEAVRAGHVPGWLLSSSKIANCFPLL